MKRTIEAAPAGHNPAARAWARFLQPASQVGVYPTVIPVSGGVCRVPNLPMTEPRPSARAAAAVTPASAQRRTLP